MRAQVTLNYVSKDSKIFTATSVTYDAPSYPAEATQHICSGEIEPYDAS
jgi:hypothetical protein